MTKWIFLICELIIFLAVYLTSFYDGNIKKGRLFSITLPSEAFKDEELKEIQENYKGKLKTSGLFILVWIIFGHLFKFPYVAIDLTFFLITLFAMIAIPSVYYSESNKLVKQLKLEKKWEAGIYSHGIHEDDFWRYGQFYNNPHDSSKYVNKRMGIGTTVNWAHKKQRNFLIILLTLASLLTIGLNVDLLYMEIKKPEFEIDHTQLYIHYPIYYYKVPLADIKSLTVIQDLPAMSKANGIATANFARGYFNVQGHGRVFVCIYKEGPYILIETTLGPILINEHTASGTYQLLEALDLVTTPSK